MMTFSPQDMAHFMRASARKDKPALEVLREMDARTGAPTVRKATPTAFGVGEVSKQGKKINALTAGEAGWILWPFPVYPAESRNNDSLN